MQTEISCIALRMVRVNDSRNLLSVWSHEHGYMTLSMPAGNSRESRRRRALTMPLSLFTAVADIRVGRDVTSVRDVMPMASSPTMGLSTIRTAGASVVAEILDLLLRRTPVEEALSEFLFDAVSFYGEASVRGAANFHISLLCHLAPFFGIFPDLPDGDGRPVFDMREGRFAASLPLHDDYLSQSDTRGLIALARVPLRHCGLLAMPRYDRRRALDLIIHYYDLHLLSLDGLKSLDILRQIFD